MKKITQLDILKAVRLPTAPPSKQFSNKKRAAKRRPARGQKHKKRDE